MGPSLDGSLLWHTTQLTRYSRLPRSALGPAVCSDSPAQPPSKRVRKRAFTRLARTVKVFLTTQSAGKPIRFLPIECSTERLQQSFPLRQGFGRILRSFSVGGFRALRAVGPTLRGVPPTGRRPGRKAKTPPSQNPKSEARNPKQTETLKSK